MPFDINNFSRRVFDSAKRMKELSPENLSQIETELKQNVDELKKAGSDVNLSVDAKKNFVGALAIFEHYDKCLQEDASMVVAALEPSRIVREFKRDLSKFLKRGERVEKSEESGGS